MINCKHGYSEETTAAERCHGFSLLQHKWQINTVYAVYSIGTGLAVTITVQSCLSFKYDLTDLQLKRF